jgi:hypothetical protein
MERGGISAADRIRRSADGVACAAACCRSVVSMYIVSGIGIEGADVAGRPRGARC